QLQRPFLFRRTTRFVVDDSERAVLQEIDAVRLRTQRHFAASVRTREREGAAQFVLEQPLDDGDAVFNLEGERALSESGGGGGPEKQRPLERPVCLRQFRKTRFGDGVEQRHRVGDSRRGDGAAAGALPFLEKALKDSMYEMSPLLGSHP